MNDRVQAREEVEEKKSRRSKRRSTSRRAGAAGGGNAGGREQREGGEKVEPGLEEQYLKRGGRGRRMKRLRLRLPILC